MNFNTHSQNRRDYKLNASGLLLALELTFRVLGKGIRVHTSTFFESHNVCMMKQRVVIVLGNVTYAVLWLSGKAILLFLQALRFLVRQFCAYQVQKEWHHITYVYVTQCLEDIGCQISPSFDHVVTTDTVIAAGVSIRNGLLFEIKARF
ncbi:TonB-dependent receptor [Babesia caballi]|uniref:TonB-dependent receptor n=1 Tax=Babesia caballi TaxID=5871 RepID=A0AAV4LZP6_BABCB|nr:TonB-dependent receptor [Babesia caballi]